MHRPRDHPERNGGDRRHLPKRTIIQKQKEQNKYKSTLTNTVDTGDNDERTIIRHISASHGTKDKEEKRLTTSKTYKNTKKKSNKYVVYCSLRNGISLLLELMIDVIIRVDRFHVHDQLLPALCLSTNRTAKNSIEGSHWWGC